MKFFLEDFSTIDIFLKNMLFWFSLNFFPGNVPFKNLGPVLITIMQLQFLQQILPNTASERAGL